MKKQLFKKVFSLFPRKYLRNMTRVLDEIQSKKLDYHRADILMHKGIRYNQCSKEPDVVDWIEKEFKAGEVFYDIGASVGPFSLITAKFFEGQVTTYAFEPAFNNLNELIQNIIINNCTSSIIPLFVPLSNETKLREFNYKSLSAGRGLNTLGEPRVQSQSLGALYTPAFKQIVQTTTIDELVYHYKLPKPTHIKLDVDGFEYQILQGAKKVLQEKGTKSVLVEIGDETADKQISDLLLSHNFKCDGEHKRRKVSNKVFKKLN